MLLNTQLQGVPLYCLLTATIFCVVAREVSSYSQSSAGPIGPSGQRYASLDRVRTSSRPDGNWSKTFPSTQHRPGSSTSSFSGESKQHWNIPRKERSVHSNCGYNYENEISHSRASCTEKGGSTSVDRTCSGSLSRRLSNHPDAKQKKSISDIVEPLNAQRLKPIRQKTRNAVVSISECNEVCLEFLQQKERQDYVIEVIRISSNGMKITTYIPNGKKGVLLTSEPPSLPANSKCATSYLYCSLPFKYWKKYQYAARFVDLVRKKTPKITLYTKYAKCMLMENSPSADFEACFYDGKVILTW